MRFANYCAVVFLVANLAGGISPACAQQKGQYLPGQFGLNAGVMPEPGITYSNITINYSAGTLTDANGNPTPVTGTYAIWAVENLFFYVPNVKVLGGKLMFGIIAPTFANGSVTVPQFGATAGGYGLADLFVQPLTLGWKLKHADLWAGYGFVAPTGRYTTGASDNIGSGYWGNQVMTGSTVYLTKNRGTTANLFTDWEVHGQREGSNVTPGQTFTMEWGFGQAIPLDKEVHKLLQVGLIGYDQWQVTSNSGTLPPGDLPVRCRSTPAMRSDFKPTSSCRRRTRCCISSIKTSTRQRRGWKDELSCSAAVIRFVSRSQNRNLSSGRRRAAPDAKESELVRRNIKYEEPDLEDVRHCCSRDINHREPFRCGPRR